MSHLTLVRHGQASFLAADYDQLSEIGMLQCERLGEYWSSMTGTRFDVVVHGPAKRHRQTGAIVGDVFRKRGIHWPHPIEIPEFGEYQAFELMRAAVPALRERDAEVREMDETFLRAEGPAEKMRAFERLFQRVTLAWVKGELDAGGVEPWAEFCVRVRRGLDQVRGEAGRNANVAVFTSAGPMSAAVAEALELGAIKTMELSWIARNSGYTEFLFSGGRFSLARFNAHPHITEPRLLTYR